MVAPEKTWTFAPGSCLASPSQAAAPKEVFQAACSELGRYFEPDGLRYVRSRPRLEQQRGDLRLQMAMWSSRANAAGDYVALEVVSTVLSKRLTTWIKKAGVGRNNAIFTVNTFDPTTKAHGKYFDVAGITPVSFVEMAERIRELCWAPMECIAADGTLRDSLHPRLEPVVENLACWFWMNGERERALALRGLRPEFVAQLRRL